MGKYELASHFECEVLSFDLDQEEALVKLKLLFLESSTTVKRVCGLKLKVIDPTRAKKALDYFFANSSSGFCKLYVRTVGEMTVFSCDLYDRTNRNVNQFLINHDFAVPIDFSLQLKTITEQPR